MAQKRKAQAQKKRKRTQSRKRVKKNISITKIKKRDGTVVPFHKEKVAAAIFKAMASLGVEDEKKADSYANKVAKELEKVYSSKRIPTVEGVQDVVEKVLIEAGEVRLARCYIMYRQVRTELRNEKKQILEKDTIDEVDKAFDVNSLRVLKSRYLDKNEDGKVIETPKELFTRVAIHSYLPTLLYDQKFFQKRRQKEPFEEEPFKPKSYVGKIQIGEYVLNEFHLEGLKLAYDRLNNDRNMKYSWSRTLRMLQARKTSPVHEKGIESFFNVMKDRKFLPNTPAIANFGRSLGMGSACFVLGLEDSMESIMNTLTNAAYIFKAGGGVGYNFSNLRPEGDRVKSTSGTASGPITFMSMFDRMTEVIKQGGIRRGANMGILNSNHPDIEKFVKAKGGNKALKNFNISVLLTDDFWKYYEKDKDYPLINPRTGEVARHISARTLFDLIVYQAWESAEPGIIFSDKVNEYNPFLKHLGPIVTTNPCGEVLLYPNESCNLGSVNVHAFVYRNGDRTTKFDWDGLKEAVMTGCELLDNVIDVNNFPLKEIEDMTRATRKIGLGVMGVADTLFALRIPYDSKEGLKFMEKLMQFVNYWSKVASIELAKKRGPLPYYRKSFYTEGKLPIAGFHDKKSWDFDWREISREVKKHGIRNGYTTVIAPTGSISMIAGTSSGIEPVFSLVFEKNVAVGSFYYIDEEFEIAMKEFGVYDEALMKDISEHRGSLQKIPYLPSVIKKVFRVAYDLTPESHIETLGIFQKWTDSSISKTTNFPKDATVEDMKKAYLLAYKLGCKDVTVFRDSSIKDQVLSTPAKKEESVPEEGQIKPSGGGNGNGGTPTSCPKCSTKLVRAEGCLKCPSCGWGLCV